MPDTIEKFLTAWTTAERTGDADRLEQLLTDNFYGVGPLGFVLPRPAWLARHRERDLIYETFRLDEIHTQMLGDVAVVSARNDTLGTYRGQPLPEALRTTLVLADGSTGWRLATIHMSFLAGTRGAPPIPGRTT